MTPESETFASHSKGGAIFRIARNAISVLVGNGLGELINAYALILAGSTLGPTGFGRLSAAQAFMETFDMLATFGLSSMVIKVAAERGGADGQLRGTSLAIRSVAAPLAVMIALPVAWLSGRGELLPVLVVLSVGTLIHPFTTTSMLPFEFDQTMHRRIALPFLSSVARLGVAVLAVRLIPTAVGFQLSGLASTVTMMILSVALARRYYPAKLHFDRALAVRLLGLAWPAAFLEFVTMLYLRGSYLMLHGHGDVVMGEYAAADRFVKPVLTIGSVFLSSALPTIATLAHKREFDVMLQTYRKAVMRMVLGVVPLLAVVWLVSPMLLERFAPRYAGALWPLRVLSLSVIFVFLNSLSSVFIMALGQLRLITVVALVNLAIYFALARALIPSYGATGAATATTVMEGVNTLMQLSIVALLLKRARGGAH